jgi:hypothetical protein
MKFSQSIPKTPQENDRPELKGGEKIKITDVLISTETKYDKIAKINGIDLVTGKPCKYRTTGKTIVKHCEQFEKGPDGITLKEPVEAEVYWHQGAKNKYLDFKDMA